ncbi:hypothetical protein DW657_13765 [Prevotella sp. AM23-5]|uniref:hypothetical protein n=1 Tax=Prevotellaceae TaxID=171552 RepID=UPI000E4FD2B6|nr:MULTISPECIES: hypothetical protein [Prevotellaceae]RHN89252.1 hypothetical protein DW657_13765 [Prevotella sp. AM23-5]
MEIVTTLVKFRCRKDVMMEHSKNAQIFLFNGKEGKTKVFVPKSKLIIKDDALDSNYNLCIIPKWVFLNTKNLSQNVELVGETQHMEVLNDIED